MSLFNLEGQVILITGGYGHLGAVMARGLRDAGATVYVLGRSEQKFTDAFKDDTASIFFQQCDISDTVTITEAFHTITEKHTVINTLINNAFYGRSSLPLEYSDEDWQYSIDGALNTTYSCIREIVPYFKQQGFGRLINISSMYGIVAPDFEVYASAPESLNPPYYGAAKAGIIQLTKYFAQYLGKHNILVNAISPGPFPNSRVQQNQAFIEALEQRTALNRIGQPEELIGPAVFLCSSASGYMTGQNLIIDGGWTIT